MNNKFLRQPTDFEKIMHFNHVFGIIAEAKPQEAGPGVRQAAFGLVEEEVKELIAAKTPEDELDGLADIQVVVGGMAARCGIDLRDLSPIREKILLGLHNAKQAASPTALRDALDQIEAYVALYAIRRGFNLAAAFDLIHENNMSKLCRDEDEARETVAYYAKQHAEGLAAQTYAKPTARQAPDGSWMVFDEDRKKILKAVSWRPPTFN